MALQHILPQFEWVPKSAVKKYSNISTMKFGVNAGVRPGFTFPLYTLFDATPATTGTPTPTTTTVAAYKSADIGGVTVTVDWLSNSPSAPVPTTATTPSSLAPAGTLSPTPTPTPTPSTTSSAATASSRLRLRRPCWELPSRIPT